ncbi:MAG TPA: TonB-dependent receptor, partial [Hyphomicrobium sp.]|nr:TonB-dependent receptor [Hyphomicrobium sp.]
MRPQRASNPNRTHRQAARRTAPTQPVAAVPRQVNPNSTITPMPAYAGGQVASGTRVGVLGNKSYMDTPFSTTGYTAQKIQDDQARSIAEVLFANDPSVRASIGSSNRYDAYTIRGLRVSQLDIALDGLYGLVPSWRVGTNPIERVELLKGPAAFLNGMAPAGSVGGSINLITKRADDTPLTRLTTFYSSDAVFGEHLDFGRRFGDQNQFGVRVNAALSGGQPPYDLERARNSDVSLGFDYRGDRFRWSTDIIYQNDWIKAQERGYNFAKGVVVPAAPDPRINLSQPYDFGRSESITGLTRGEYDLTDSITAFAAIGANGFNFSKRETNGGTIINNAGDVDTTGSNALQNGRYTTVTGEAGLRARFTTGPFDHQATISANGFDQVYQVGQTSYGGYLTNIYSPVRTDTAVLSSYPVGNASKLRMGGVAFADTMSWHDVVQLTLGGRQQSIEGINYSGTTGRVTSQYDDSGFSPSVGLVVRPIKQLSLYANYIEGLTPGGIAPSSAVNSGEIFAPFRTKQYEVGTKLDLGRLGFGISAFQITVPQGITDPTTHIFALDGQQRNRGIELTTFGEVTPGIRVLGGITFFDARQTATAGGVTDGNFAVGVPKTQITMGGEWDIPAIPGLTLTGRVIYTGRTFVDAANLQPVPDWTRLDLGARYKFIAGKTPIVVRANITNALNSRY